MTAGGALRGKVAVITGGTSGIGLATARRFVAEGAHVFIVGRRQSELDKAALELGKNATAVRGDISKLDDIDALYAVVASKGVGIDIIFANAAFVEIAATEVVTLEHFEETFDTNVRGVFFTVQKGLPLLKDGGRIIVTGATGKDKAYLGRGIYSATKAALRSFVRTWTSELRGRGIRANMLSPGPVDTPILDGLFESQELADKAKAHAASIIPMGRIGRPNEIAAAALFLASDESSFITGIDLVVDGGLTAV